MGAFDVLGDPVRRRILEILAQAEQSTSGEIVAIIHAEFGISQSAVSQHLKVLRDAGLAHVTVAGNRRLYRLDAAPLSELADWIGKFSRFWQHKLDALATEVERGTRGKGR